MPLSLLALAIAAFGIGTTEFVIMGLLPSVARDLGVNIPQAGYLVSGYALGVVIGAPIVAMLTVRLPRKPALLGMIGVFIVGNVLCALAPNYSLLLCARIVTAFCHGAFFGIGAVVAADLVPQKERARAIALMFAGLTLANVLGVPAGTALGEAYGWRSTFWAVVAIGIVAMAALAVWLPANIPMKRANLVREFRVLGNAQVLLAMLISILGSASLFSVFTYIAPFLEHVTGFRSATVTIVLLVFGVGLTLGNMLGGRLADWKLMPSLLGVLVLLAAILTVFTFTSHSQAATIATIFVWGVAAFALVPLLQMRIVEKASSAPNLASTLNQGAFNLGNAGGAWLGGASLGIGVGYEALPWLGAGVALLALATTVLSEAMDRRPRATYALH
jgi:DHA1 family inner membrane transport protein